MRKQETYQCNTKKKPGHMDSPKSYIPRLTPKIQQCREASLINNACVYPPPCRPWYCEAKYLCTVAGREGRWVGSDVTDGMDVGPTEQLGGSMPCCSEV